MLGNWMTILAIGLGGLLMAASVILISPLLAAVLVCVVVAVVVAGLLTLMSRGSESEISGTDQAPTGSGPSENPQSGGAPGSSGEGS